jgi:hypothetical protein
MTWQNTNPIHAKDEAGCQRTLCSQCGTMLPKSKKMNARFCSDVCKQRAYRRRQVGAPESMARERSTGSGALKYYAFNERNRRRLRAQSVT